MPEEKKFPQAIQKVEELVARLENIREPAAKAGAQELVQALMDLHGAGLQRIVDMIWQSSAAGEGIMDTLGRDELVGNLLLLYGLHPVDMQSRVQSALEKVRPYLKSHGGNVELIEITEDAIVRLRLEGSCHGCPSSSVTMKLAIEEAIYEAAPDIGGLSVEGVVEPPRPPVPLLQINPMPGKWEEVPGVEALAQGAVQTVDVKGRPVLVCRIEDTYYAYGSECPACRQPLRDARLEQLVTLVCPSCGQQFDALRAGRSLDQPALHLQPFPLLMEHGRPKVALPGV